MDGVEVIHGDCLDMLPTFKAGLVDAIVTDPPWGMNYRSHHNTRRSGKWDRWCRDEDFAPIEGDDRPFDPSPWLGFSRVAFFGANFFASHLPDSRGWVVWDKLDGLNPDRGSDCEMVWTNQNKPMKMYRHMWRGLLRRGSENVARQPKYHPHQKPVSLLIWLMDYLEIPQGATVLDPYAGSGSLGVACIKSGRKCILIEKDKRYISVIRRRLEEAETPLFSGISD